MRSSRHRERAKAPRHDACACSFLLHSWSLLLAVLLLCCGEIVAEVRSVSKVYHSVCLQKGQQYWDYDSYALTSMATESVDSFEITRRLDSGKFSQVMEAIDIRDNRLVVLKILKPVQPKKVKREICILQTLAGGPNIVALEGVCRDEETDTTCLVLEHLGPGARWLAHGGPRHSAAATFAAAAAAAPPTAPEPLLSSAAEAMSGAGAAADQATSPSAVEMKLSDTDVKCFMYRLLEALDYSHSRGIMHRDVKPWNVVLNRDTGTLRLIDWGLADFYIPGKRYMVLVGSRHYKAPELLVGYRFYDYAVDVFSAGCVLAGLLFRREPFFRGRDNNDQLVRIACVLGTAGLERCVRRYDVAVEPELQRALGQHSRKPWEAYVTPETAALCTPAALDLLDRMLCWDHQERISAADALRHPFFDAVRTRAGSAGVAEAAGKLATGGSEIRGGSATACSEKGRRK